MNQPRKRQLTSEQLAAIAAMLKLIDRVRDSAEQANAGKGAFDFSAISEAIVLIAKIEGIK